ncbi:MAG TPA: HAMP domain-containing sensor histidine kinase [Actinomycetota bacterium]|nr:HAMP domain-containing sensor histidine kinase [Actinomycetota bacterium]
MTRGTLAFVGVVGIAGAVASLGIGAASGMQGDDLASLGILLAVAVAASVGVAALAGWLLARASFRRRTVGVAVAGVAVSLVNLLALAMLMFVSAHDAALTAILLTYAGAVGVATGLALAQAPAAAVARLAATARRLGEGDLGARVGKVRAGPEVETLARTLDEMADRVQASVALERESEARRRDLITAVSHDLRTPLAGLRAIAEAVQDGVADDPSTLQRYAAEIGRTVGSLSTLVDDLMELSQLDGESVRAETRRGRLADVVASALAACEPQVRAKGITVEVDLTGADEGASCSPRLARVLQNLVQNAVRHTPGDGSVWVEAHQRPDGLEVTVTDTGEGIAARPVDRVFEPFWRGDAARTSPGSGLGLALAKRIVEAMGGGISVESAPNRGSRFAILLPEE